MAIRFNPYFFATQYHPEVDPDDMKDRLIRCGDKEHMIEEYGEAKFEEIFSDLDDPGKLKVTYDAIIPQFLSRPCA